MFISRNYNRSEEDDFKLNIQPSLSDIKEALEVYREINKEKVLVGWTIQMRFE